MTTINQFNIDNELALRLEGIAKKINLTAPEILTNIVEQFVNNHASIFPEGQERRAFKRVDINIPAVVSFREDHGSTLNYIPACIADISSIGIRIVCSSDKIFGWITSENVGDYPFDLIFTFSDEMKPVKLRCKAKWLKKKGDEIQIGALVVSSSPGNICNLIAESGLCG